MKKTLLAMLRGEVSGTGEKLFFILGSRRVALRRDAFGNPNALRRALAKQHLTEADITALLGSEEEVRVACDFVLGLPPGRALKPQAA